MAKALESAGWRVCNIGYPSTTQAIPDDDGKVSVASARLEGMRDFLVVPVSHPFLMRDEAVIAQTLRYLREGGFEHPPVEPEPPAIPGEVAAGDGEASWRTLLGGAAYTPAQRVPRRVPDDATDTDDGAPRPPFVDDGDAAGAGFVPVVALTLRRDDVLLREARSCGEVTTATRDVATTLHFDPAAGRYVARDR